MKAEVKNIYSPGLENLTEFQPNEINNFCVLFRVLVGPKGGEGEESFDIQICTPLWLLSNIKKDEVVLLRHCLIVLEYDYNRICARIKSLIENEYGQTWKELAEKIARIGYWEFEDYTE